MALSATDFTGQKRTFVQAGKFKVRGIYTGPASYTAGGEVLTAAIAHAAFGGMNTIDRLDFAPLYDVTNSKMAQAAFDYNRSGTTMGKIHISSGGEGAHAHDILVKGSGTIADAVGRDSTDILVKTAATDKTLAAGQGTKNIQQNTASVSSGDVAAAGNYSTFTCRFEAEGS